MACDRFSAIVLLAIVGVSGCRPKNYGTLQSLDAFATGDIHLRNNTCSGDPNAEHLPSPLLGSIVLDSDLGEAEQSYFLQAALVAISALPRSLQASYAAKHGKVRLTKDIRRDCKISDSLPRSWGFEACNGLGDSDAMSDPSPYITILANEDAIRRALVREFGLFLAEVDTHLEYVGAVDLAQAFLFMPHERPGFLAIKDQLFRAFQLDLVAGGLFDEREIFSPSHGSDDGKRRQRYRNFVFAEAFDSFYCNGWNRENLEVIEAVRTHREPVASLSKVYNTREIARVLFPDTYEKFRSLVHCRLFATSGDPVCNVSGAALTTEIDGRLPQPGVFGTFASVSDPRTLALARAPVAPEVARVTGVGQLPQVDPTLEKFLSARRSAGAAMTAMHRSGVSGSQEANRRWRQAEQAVAEAFQELPPETQRMVRSADQESLEILRAASDASRFDEANAAYHRRQEGVAQAMNEMIRRMLPSSNPEAMSEYERVQAYSKAAKQYEQSMDERNAFYEDLANQLEKPFQQGADALGQVRDVMAQANADGYLPPILYESVAAGNILGEQILRTTGGVASGGVKILRDRNLNAKVDATIDQTVDEANARAKLYQKGGMNSTQSYAAAWFPGIAAMEGGITDVDADGKPRGRAWSDRTVQVASGTSQFASAFVPAAKAARTLGGGGGIVRRVGGVVDDSTKTRGATSRRDMVDTRAPRGHRRIPCAALRGPCEDQWDEVYRLEPNFKSPPRLDDVSAPEAQWVLQDRVKALTEVRQRILASEGEIDRLRDQIREMASRAGPQQRHLDPGVIEMQVRIEELAKKIQSDQYRLLRGHQVVEEGIASVRDPVRRRDLEYFWSQVSAGRGR